MIPEDQEEEFIDQWWYNRPRLRKFFAPLLYISSWQYRLWRFLKKPPEERRKKVESQAKKIRKRAVMNKIVRIILPAVSEREEGASHKWSRDVPA